MSVSVHVYRHCILQVRYRDFTEILLTFVMSINGSSFPVCTSLSMAFLLPKRKNTSWFNESEGFDKQNSGQIHVSFQSI